MERKQGLFSAFKEELVRARPRGRRASPSASEIIRRRRPGGETLSPLMEGPDPSGSDCKSEKWGNWIFRPPSGSGSDLRLLLGILGAPLAPVHVTNNDPLPHLTIKHTPIVSLCLSLHPLFSLYIFLFLDSKFLIFIHFTRVNE